MDSAVIREESEEAGGKPRVRAAESGEEVRESTLQFMKEWMGWGRSFWFHSETGKVPATEMGGVLWPEDGVT